MTAPDLPGPSRPAGDVPMASLPVPSITPPPVRRPGTGLRPARHKDGATAGPAPSQAAPTGPRHRRDIGPDTGRGRDTRRGPGPDPSFTPLPGLRVRLPATPHASFLLLARADGDGGETVVPAPVPLLAPFLAPVPAPVLAPVLPRHPARLLVPILLLVLLALLPRALGATTPAPAPDPSAEELRATAAICDQAAEIAGRETGVPADVLRALTRTETGRRLAGATRPWPWTVNMEGKGFWFDSPAEALAYAEARRAAGSRSFDMGCFQVNYRWHGQHFAALDAMMDPLTNARYAARFLGTLFAELGDWSRAAGAYHSRTAEFATRYRARFDRLLAGLADPGAPGAPTTELATDLARLVLPATGTLIPAAIARIDRALPRTPGGVMLTESVPQGGLLIAAAPGGLLTRARPLFD